VINVHRSAAETGSSIALRRGVRALAIALSIVAAIGTVPASAQQRGNPFAGRRFGGAGPYGSDAGAMPHLMQVPQIMVPPGMAERRRGMAGVVVQPSGEPPGKPELLEANQDNTWEAIFVGCTAGGFLGGFSAATTTSVVSSGAAAVPVGMALPVLAGTVASAAAIGCGVGVATAAVSVSAAALWHWLAR
jgi:hypothetical protein